MSEETEAWWRGRSLLYLSGTAGDTRRYRCEYGAEAIASLGVDTAIAAIEDVDLDAMLADYDCFVLHRVAYDPDVARFIERARRLRKPAIYDTDDYVFDAAAASLVGWPPGFTVDERRESFERQGRTLAACAGAIASTRSLAALARRFNDRVAVLPNMVGTEMVAEADAAMRSARGCGSPGETTIVYMSGTPTHDRDFLVAADALLFALERFPDLRLRVIGYLMLDERFDRFDERVERVDYQPRARLPELVHGNVVNLAPLVPNNPFATAKSCVKYLEAGLVATPTVASRLGDYERVIQDGSNGFLASRASEWHQHIARLVEDSELRRQLGAAAYGDVRRRHVTAARGWSYARVLRLMIASCRLESAADVSSRRPNAPNRMTGSHADRDVADTEDRLREHVDRIASLGAELARLADELTRREERLEFAERDRDLAEGRLRELEDAFSDERFSSERAIYLLEAELESRNRLFEEAEDERALLRVENRRLIEHLGAIDATLSWRVTRPLRAIRRILPKPHVAHVAAVSSASQNGAAAVLFLSGAPEVARRYRCDHQAEQLQLLGATTHIGVFGKIDLTAAVDRYTSFVLHRVPWGSDVEVFFERTRALGKPVLFDTDDLVFDLNVPDYVSALEDLPQDEVKLYREGLHRYRRTMRECDAVVVSTAALQRLAADVHDRVVVAPNVASREMTEAAEAVLRAKPGETRLAGHVTIGYMSGTNTHKRDFAEAADGLLKVLDARPQARLRIVGPLIVDPRFERLSDRVERLPTQSWRRLARSQAGIDVNLAPLEPANPFTESKSSIKWIEAGIVGIPTIASPRPDFERVIQDGENGFLAEGADTWERKLLALVDDSDLRRQVGEQARRDVLARHTTCARAADYYETLRDLLPTRDADPLTINWIMQAPIAQNSGGYRNIFRIATALGDRGHIQHLYVQPHAHLSGFNVTQIRRFIEKEFRIPVRAEVLLGHEEIAPADISIATHWPTAAVVAEHSHSLFKGYFIQDFEPEFYEPADSRYRAAERSYRLPLRHICLGKHLAERLRDSSGVPSELVDFALDPCFKLATPPDHRGEPIRVLFFARPSLRRRGYDVGIEALRRIKEVRPDVEIVFFGTSTQELGRVPFEFRNLGVLDASSVAEAMNDSHILLTFSLTNISNVPYEGMACGCAVVDLDLPNVTSMVDRDRNCLVAEFEPGALADAVIRLVDDRDLRVRLGTRGAAESETRTWDRTATMFEQALLRTCFARLEPLGHRAGHEARA